MDSEDKVIQWHDAFRAAMRLELRENEGELVFEDEHILNMKPLLVDLVVIKRPPGVAVRNEIGRFFREYNILEYKSPDDTLNVDAYFKTLAYASLYKVYHAGEPEIEAKQIGLTLIHEGRPRKLMKYFEQHGYKVARKFTGVYEVRDLVPFATQLIVSGELDPEMHVWLTALTKKLDKARATRLLRHVDGTSAEQERRNMEAVLYVAVNANKMTFEAWRKEEPEMYASLLDFLKPEIDAEKEAMKTDIAHSLMKNTKLLDEQIAINTKLPLQRVREIRAQMGATGNA